MKLRSILLCGACIVHLATSTSLHASNDLNMSEAEIFYARQNALAEGKRRNFLLKVAIPVGITAMLGYAVLHQYQKTAFTTIRNILPKDTTPSFYNAGKTLYNGCQAIYYDATPLQIIEFLAVIGQAAARSKGFDNNVFIDAMRILNSLLFMFNKNQYTVDALLDGGYYTACWLLYDVYSLINNLGLFGGDEQETQEQFDKLGKALNTYILPVLETAATMHLALNIGDGQEAQALRHQMQSIYSLIRTLSLYLTAKNDIVDVLLVLHALATLYPILNDAWFGLRSNSAPGAGSTQSTPGQPQQPTIPEDSTDHAAAEQQANNQATEHRETEEQQGPEQALANNAYEQINNAQGSTNAGEHQEPISPEQQQSTARESGFSQNEESHDFTLPQISIAMAAANSTKQRTSWTSKPKTPENNEQSVLHSAGMEIITPASWLNACILRRSDKGRPAIFLYVPPALHISTKSTSEQDKRCSWVASGRVHADKELCMPTGSTDNLPLSWQYPPLSSTIDWDAMDLRHEKMINFDLLKKVSAQLHAATKYKQTTSVPAEQIAVQEDRQNIRAPSEPLFEQVKKQIAQAQRIGLIPARN
jgi:hypothetical protein